MKRLEKLYKKFLKFNRFQFIRDTSLFLGTEGIDEKYREKVYEYYEKYEFLKFLSLLRSVIFLDPIKALKFSGRDLWDLYWILEFMKEEGMIDTKGRVEVDEELKKHFLPIFTEKEIRKKIARSLRISSRRIDLLSTEDFVKKLGVKFEWKSEYDQLPISLSSACFIISKISERYPIQAPFLFVGDDDFLSLLIKVIYPEFPCVVVDADDLLLRCLKEGGMRLGVEIETKKVDVRKKKKIGKKFFGFLTNPPYTQGGVKTFVDFGVRSMGELGGMCFIEIGDEAIGTRWLFLQEFFTKRNLLVDEICRNSVKYFFKNVHREDEIVKERLKEMGIKIGRRDPMLMASLIIAYHIPWKVRKIKEKTIYSYV